MAVPDRLRLPLDFDPALLMRDAALATAWVNHHVRYNYDGEWQAVALRAPADARHPIATINAFSPTGAAFVDTPLLARCSYFGAVLSAFACPLRSVRLMRLSPGSSIKEHFDDGLSFEDGHVRLHIPILTNAEVDFRINGVRVDMTPGSTWYLRFADPHSVANRGACDRIHLVIDAQVDDWLRSLFAQATILRQGLFLERRAG